MGLQLSSVLAPGARRPHPRDQGGPLRLASPGSGSENTSASELSLTFPSGTFHLSGASERPRQAGRQVGRWVVSPCSFLARKWRAEEEEWRSEGRVQREGEEAGCEGCEGLGR